MPPVGVTEAIPEAAILQVPGVVASLNGVVKPMHTAFIPVMGAGNGLTVSGIVIIQVVGKV